MDYRVLLQEENEAVRERYDLSMERIGAMGEEEMGQPYGSYFKRTAEFIRMMGGLVQARLSRGTSGEREVLPSSKRRTADFMRIFSRSITGRAMGIQITRWRHWERGTASSFPFYIRKYGGRLSMPLRCVLNTSRR